MGFSFALGLLSTVIAFGGASARAEAPVSWVAPAGCPSPEQVRRAVTRLRAPQRGLPAASALRVRARVRREEGGTGWAAQVRFEGANVGAAETRALRAETCDALGEAVAVLAAIALEEASAPRTSPATTALADPVVTTVAPSKDRATLAGVDDPTATSPAQLGTDAESRRARAQGPRSPEPLDRRRRSEPRFDMGLRAGPALAVGPLPAPGLGVGGGIAARLAWMRMELDASYWAPQAAPDAQLDGAGVSVDLWAVALRGCPTPRIGALSFPICVGAELGQMRGRGFGIEAPRRATSLWAAAHLRPTLHVALHPHLALLVAVEGLIALRRPAFHLDERAPLHRAPIWGLRPQVGLEWVFG